MLKKRIIPCLDIQNGRTVKGTCFENLVDAGDPVELARMYAASGADELVFLDITATIEKRKTLVTLVEKVAAQINIPFTVGGGIGSLENVQEIIEAGADKVSINSSAVKNKQLVTDIASRYGSQCVVVAIDTKKENGTWKVFVHGGRTNTGLATLEWAQNMEEAGAGEILLTSMDHDGSKNGFALDLVEAVSAKVNIPVIASGGAGKMIDFKEVFEQTKASAALAASIFHFGEVSLPGLKQYLQTQNIPVRL